MGASGGDVQRNNNAPVIEYFTCTDIIDLNKNGEIDTEKEVIDKNRTEFYVGDHYRYVARLINLKGRVLKFYAQDAPGSEPMLVRESVIPNDWLVRTFSKGTLEKPAHWHAYVTMDDVKIADFRINVKEDPSRTISRD